MPERLKTLGCLPLPVGVLRTRRQIEIQDGARRKDDGDGEAGNIQASATGPEARHPSEASRRTEGVRPESRRSIAQTMPAKLRIPGSPVLIQKPSGTAPMTAETMRPNPVALKRTAAAMKPTSTMRPPSTPEGSRSCAGGN